MRLFIAINFDNSILEALTDFQEDLRVQGMMTAARVSLMRSERGKHGMIYTELGGIC